MINQQNIFYAHKSGNEFYKFYPTLVQTKMCGEDKIYKIHVRALKEDEKSDYWAWFDYRDNDITLIYLNKEILSMCFPYGLEAAERYKEGTAINVFVEEIE